MGSAQQEISVLDLIKVGFILTVFITLLQKLTFSHYSTSGTKTGFLDKELKGLKLSFVH